jgi:hypothetical protein
MITRKQAQQILHAFTWTDGTTFLEAYNKTYPLEDRAWTGYIEDQFHLMQTKPLDFIIKWTDLAAEITAIHAARCD